jgi:hypothetical protein
MAPALGTDEYFEWLRRNGGHVDHKLFRKPIRVKSV